MSKMNGKIVTVVGGGSGIGKAIVEAVRKQDGDVVLSSRTAAKLEAVAGRYDGYGVG